MSSDTSVSAGEQQNPGFSQDPNSPVSALPTGHNQITIPNTNGNNPGNLNFVSTVQNLNQSAASGSHQNEQNQNKNFQRANSTPNPALSHLTSEASMTGADPTLASAGTTQGDAQMVTQRDGGDQTFAQDWDSPPHSHSQNRDGYQSVPTTGMYAGGQLSSRIRVYARKSSVESLKTQFHEWGKILWTEVDTTRLYSTMVRRADVVQMRSLVSASALVVDEGEFIRSNAKGVVDVWPDRYREGKVWKTYDRWSGEEDLRAMLKALRDKGMSPQGIGASMYYGKLALRVHLSGHDYAKIGKVCADLQLQFQRISAAPMPMAELTVKLLQGNTDDLPEAVLKAREKVENTFPQVSWGRQRASPGTLSVLVFIPHLTLKDNFSTYENGIRTTLSTAVVTDNKDTNAAAEELKSQAKVFEQPSQPHIEVPHNPAATAEELARGPLSTEDQDTLDKEYESLTQAVEAAKAAATKAVQSWKAFRLPSEVGVKAVTTLIKTYPKPGELSASSFDEALGTVAMYRDYIESFAAWANTCPTPSDVATRASDSDLINMLANQATDISTKDFKRIAQHQRAQAGPQAKRNSSYLSAAVRGAVTARK
jgi:hypothetical protein